MNELVEIVGLTKSYDTRSIAVNNVTLTLPKGKIIGLLGPNGSGKTTLIKMLNGLLTPTSGSIKINGQYWRKPDGGSRNPCIYPPGIRYLYAD